MKYELDGIREEAIARTETVSSILKSYAAKHDPIFIDPTPIFCPNNANNCLKFKTDSYCIKMTITLVAQALFF